MPPGVSRTCGRPGRQRKSGPGCRAGSIAPWTTAARGARVAGRLAMRLRATALRARRRRGLPAGVEHREVAFLERGDVARVEAERGADVGVAELAADEVDRHAGGERERREGVATLRGTRVF